MTVADWLLRGTDAFGPPPREAGTHFRRPETLGPSGSPAALVRDEDYGSFARGTASSSSVGIWSVIVRSLYFWYATRSK